ncbi:copine family protein [Nitzschia inconspicua]|uniref:Copine family protein n=1 Tax=Nitzschia inconspicua TaxID=303405 RepID=A0A9K3KPR3_9STRA|nr:copine family protein [Nitzschia inconspicua]
MAEQCTPYHEESSSDEDENQDSTGNWSFSHQHLNGVTTTAATRNCDHHEYQQLTVNLVLRIHAANLPRYGMRKLWPDTYTHVQLFRVASAANQTSSLASDVEFDPFSPNSLESESNFSEMCNSVIQKEDIGRTEIIYGNTHPQYITTFPLSYIYGSKSYVSIDIYRLKYSSDQEPIRIGSEIGDVLGSKNRTKVKRLRSGGVIFCRLEMAMEQEQQSQVRERGGGSLQQSFIMDSSYYCRGRFRVQFRADELRFSKRHRTPSALWGHKPDTMLQIQKQHANSSQQAWMTVYRSSPVYESTTPTFDEGEIDLGCLCDGDLDKPIRIGIWCLKKRSTDILVGICETTVKSILEGNQVVRGRQCEGHHQSKDCVHHSFRLCRSVQKRKDVGRLDIISAELFDSFAQEPSVTLFDNITDNFAAREEDSHPQEECHSGILEEERSSDLFSIGIPVPIPPPVSFRDFMKTCPCELDLMVAIDFTSSNGDPRRPGTLHEQSAEHLNDYEETMVAVAGAMVDFCKSISVYGFGAKYGGTTRHIFQCNACPIINPREDGVNGILRAYKSVFETDLIMSGPTVYDQVLQAAAVRARKCQSSRQYTVLLVITDGLAQDMEETRRKLQVYSGEPLSVVFVGLGRADFAGMYRLCEIIGNNTGRPNVTFVEFRRHQHDPFSLGMAALQELPTQIEMYLEQK